MAITLKPLHQQVIVITGASSGIGLATAFAAARAAAPRSCSPHAAQQTLAERSSLDIRDMRRRRHSPSWPTSATARDARAHRRGPRSSSSAASTPGSTTPGVSIYGRLDEVTDEDSRTLFDTNFWGVVNGSLVALPYLQAAGRRADQHRQRGIARRSFRCRACTRRASTPSRGSPMRCASSCEDDGATGVGHADPAHRGGYAVP